MKPNDAVQPLEPSSDRELEPARPFRRRDARAVWDLHFGPNMTPMVDVTLVILIFFMASTAFIGPEWVLELATRDRDPSALAARATLPGAVFEIEIRRTPEGLRLHGLGIETDDPGAMARTGADVAAGAPTSAFVLRPEGGVPYQDVLRAHEAFANARLSVSVSVDGSRLPSPSE